VKQFLVLSLVFVAALAPASARPEPGFAPSGRNLAAPAETARLDVFVGKWEVRELGAGPDAPIVARSHGYYVLDGFVLQEDYRGLDAAGNVAFRGTSLRTYDPSSGKIVIKWMMANNAGYTNILAHAENGDIVSEGQGRDWFGKDFLERFRFFDISETGRSFEMERSFDGGKTWTWISRVRLTRVED